MNLLNVTDFKLFFTSNIAFLIAWNTPGDPEKYCVNTVRLTFLDENSRLQKRNFSPSRRKTDYCRDGDSSRLLP